MTDFAQLSSRRDDTDGQDLRWSSDLLLYCKVSQTREEPDQPLTIVVYFVFVDTQDMIINKNDNNKWFYLGPLLNLSLGNVPTNMGLAMDLWIKQTFSWNSVLTKLNIISVSGVLMRSALTNYLSYLCTNRFTILST